MNPFLKKPLALVSLSDSAHSRLERTMGLLDLVAIGVGGTVGSGVFVLTGLIANQYAGPGVVFSWLIAGMGCVCSALSYAELSNRIPSAGSAYAYAYLALGELPAVLAGTIMHFFPIPPLSRPVHIFLISPSYC
jgi:basic amino acid/polyamine antiporter, APA family